MIVYGDCFCLIAGASVSNYGMSQQRGPISGGSQFQRNLTPTSLSNNQSFTAGIPQNSPNRYGIKQIKLFSLQRLL